RAGVLAGGGVVRVLRAQVDDGGGAGPVHSGRSLLQVGHLLGGQGARRVVDVATGDPLAPVVGPRRGRGQAERGQQEAAGEEGAAGDAAHALTNARRPVVGSLDEPGASAGGRGPWIGRGGGPSGSRESVRRRRGRSGRARSRW